MNSAMKLKLLFLTTFCLAALACAATNPLEYKYTRVQIGMSKAEVVSVLGEVHLAFTLAQHEIPTAPKINGGKPIVQGDEAMQWNGFKPKCTIWIGFNDGKVFDKALRKPSL